MARLRYLSNARTGDAGTVCEGNLLINGDIEVTGSYTYGSGSLPLSQNLQGTFTVGQDATGYDVKFYGDTTDKYWLWDESANGVVLVGEMSITGDVILTTTSKLYFHDDGGGEYIYASADGALVIAGATTIALNSTTVNVTATTLALAGAMTSTGAITISPATHSTFVDFALETEWVHGTLINADSAAGGVTFDGDVIGVFMDFNGNITPATDCDITGYKVEFAGLTATNDTTFIGFDLPTADAIDVGSSATFAWKGVNLQLPNGSETSGTTNVYGVYVAAGTYVAGQEYGVYITGTQTGVAIAGAVVAGIAISGASTGNAITISQTTNSATTGYAMAIGLTGAHLTTATASASLIKIYADTTATSGDNRGIYNRYYLKSTGGGESFRTYTLIDGDVTVGTAHGAHISLGMGESTTVGNVSGLGVATRSTLGLASGASDAGGTYAAIMPEIYSFGSGSDAGAVTELSFIRCCNDGNATGIATVDDDAFLLVLAGGADASGNIFYHNTLRVKADDAAKYIPLSTAEGTFTTAYPIVSTCATAISATSTLTAAVYPIYSKADIQTNASSGVFINNYVLTEISTAVDLSGTAQVLGIDSMLSIEGADSGITTLSSTGAFTAIAAYYYTNDENIDVTNGIHSCIMAAPYYGADYTVSAAGDFAGLFLFQCGNSSATVPADQNSAILVSKNTGADNWGSVINIASAGVVDYMFNMPDDDVLCGYNGNAATAGDPDGFIKIIIGGQTSYIWTYTNIA